jgi:acyl-CoA thioesterase
MCQKQNGKQEVVDGSDAESFSRVIEAWKRSKESSSAFIDELLNVDFLGFDAEKHVYRYQMWITDELKNRFDTLHGGITATFVDITMGHSLLKELGQQTKIVTLDLSIRYVSPGLKGRIVAEIEIVKKGKTILTLEAKIWDEQKKPIAIAMGTFFRTE